MPCYHPLQAFQRRAGGPVVFSGARPGDRHIKLPCGRCIGCRLAHAREWAIRCMHEAKMHEHSCFATLTYDEAHCPRDLSLEPRQVQLFLKRLRERLREIRVEPKATSVFRYFVCGEYGEINSRPHYHALLFGFAPTDKVLFARSKAGYDVYRSAFLDSVWQMGAVYVGDVSLESAGYVARYALKKVGSDGDKREILDVTTGEIVRREHEFARMSLRPGIGRGFYDRYFSDLYPADRVVVDGVKYRIPRFYDKLLDKFSPLYLAELKAARVASADKRYERLVEADRANRFQDVERLDVHEFVKTATVRSLKRS